MNFESKVEPAIAKSFLQTLFHGCRKIRCVRQVASPVAAFANRRSVQPLLGFAASAQKIYTESKCCA